MSPVHTHLMSSRGTTVDRPTVTTLSLRLTPLLSSSPLMRSKHVISICSCSWSCEGYEPSFFFTLLPPNFFSSLFLRLSAEVSSFLACLRSAFSSRVSLGFLGRG